MSISLDQIGQRAAEAASPSTFKRPAPMTNAIHQNGGVPETPYTKLG